MGEFQRGQGSFPWTAGGAMRMSTWSTAFRTIWNWCFDDGDPLLLEVKGDIVCGVKASRRRTLRIRRT
jgi:hypothetical protein